MTYIDPKLSGDEAITKSYDIKIQKQGEYSEWWTISSLTLEISELSLSVFVGLDGLGSKAKFLSNLIVKETNLIGIFGLLAS